MERQRNFKLLVIAALTLSIVGLAVGFAAFSKVLTITAQATVVPNEEDFSVTIYGLKSAEAISKIMSTGVIPEAELTETLSVPLLFNSEDNNKSATPATIDNDNFIINDISSTTNTCGDIALYVFVIKNTGAFDVYFMPLNAEKKELKTCTASEGSQATETEINYVCENIELGGVNLSFDSTNNEWKEIEEDQYPYLIEPGEQIMFSVIPRYGGTNKLYNSVDITFNPIKLNFSTSPSIE